MSILDIRQWAKDIPAVVAMSGTPVSVGPVDIKGPLMCLTSGNDDNVIEELDKMDKRFKELVELEPPSKDMPRLIMEFGKLYQSRTLRRTEDSLWFGEKILDLPPVQQRDMDVAFPDEYRQDLKNLTLNIAGDIEQGLNQTEKQKMSTFYKTITRQQLLASTIPWLVTFWGGPRGDRGERLLAASYAQDHLDSDGNWLPSNPFHGMGNLYTGGHLLPKFRALDEIIKQAHERNSKMLVFSGYIAVASFAQHVSLPTSVLYIILCLHWSTVPLSH